MNKIIIYYGKNYYEQILVNEEEDLETALPKLYKCLNNSKDSFALSLFLNNPKAIGDLLKEKNTFIDFLNDCTLNNMITRVFIGESIKILNFTNFYLHGASPSTINKNLETTVLYLNHFKIK